MTIEQFRNYCESIHDIDELFETLVKHFTTQQTEAKTATVNITIN